MNSYPLKKFKGFGDGDKNGEYFYSAGMHKTGQGIAPGWEVRKAIDSADLSGLLNTAFFAQVTISGTNYIYSVNRTSAAEGADGKIFRASAGSDSFSSQHTTGQTSYGNGLITDQKGRLLYPQTRYLGMFDGSSYTDNWKDFGGSISPVDAFRPATLFEDMVLIGNGNKVAALFTTDDSWNTEAFTLPTGFLITSIKANRTGILIGANTGNRSVLILWDGYSDRSIAPWIWLKDNVSAIEDNNDLWIVSLGNKLLLTNGYTTKPLPSLPDTRINDFNFTMLLPSSILVKDDYLFIATGRNVDGRVKYGVWILDLVNLLWEFCPISNRCLNGVTMGALFSDNAGNFYLGYKTASPAKSIIGRLYNTFTGSASAYNKAIYMVTAAPDNNKKVAVGLQLNLNFLYRTELAFAVSKPTIKIKAKIFDFSRRLYSYAVTNATGTTTTLRVDGSGRPSGAEGQVEIGDEVTILDGTNAGEIRHITAITNKGASNETWTLDSALAGTTASGVNLEVTPFKLIDTQTIDNFQINDFYFDIQNHPQGRKFMIKLVFEFETAGVTVLPEITGLTLLYDDLGLL